MKKSHHTLIQLVNLLNDQAYHPGDAVGIALSMSRAGIWKYIKKLRAYGIEIRSVKGKGYQLTQPLTLMEEERINIYLSKHMTLHMLETVDSTNTFLRALPLSPHPVICIAEQQSVGRGRLKREWHSPFAQNLYFSFAYTLEKNISELGGLSLMVALAVCAAIEKTSPLKDPLQIKWPNDILINDKKIAGILIEANAETQGFCQIIIGIGVNVNMREAPSTSITQAWTSLYAETGLYQDRNKLAAALIKQLESFLSLFSEQGLSPFLKAWQERDYLFNQVLSLTAHQLNIVGIGQGVNAQGHLLVHLPDNTIRSFSSGESTLIRKQSSRSHS